MDWTDRGIVLSARKHGETALIVQLLTEHHGRHAGLVRGGGGARARGIYQAGNLVAVAWRARLAEHLGNYQGELLRSTAGRHLDDPGRLAALTAAAAIIEVALPERAPQAEIFAALLDLIERLDGAAWPSAYIRWELGLLSTLGFGLDLRTCAATGQSDALAYVSPKSGRAVSAAAGAPYRARLLALPPFLLGGAEAGPADLVFGLKLTAHFLEEHVFAPQGRRLPPARQRLTAQIGAMAPQPIDV